jgi:hypothetical protein
MTKQTSKQVANLDLHRKLGNDYAVASGLSALIRSSMRKAEKQELLELAAAWDVINHQAFIV